MLLITTPNVNKDIKILIDTAQALNWSIFNDSWRIPERIKDSIGVVYGEPMFCETVAEQMNWRLHRNQFDWITKLPIEYVNREIVFTSLREARKLKEKKFIKHAADFKSFMSNVFENGEQLVETLDDNIPVLVSDVMRFTSKYCCLIKDRQVISSCCFWLKTKQMEAQQQSAEFNLPKNYDNNHMDVVNFVNNMLKNDKVDCVNSCVIEVGRFDKDKYAVIGTNPIYTSPLYGCDAVALLDGLRSSCREN